MKSKMYFLIAGISLICLLTSCKKDDEKEEISNLTTNSSLSEGLLDWESCLVYNGTISEYNDEGNKCVKMYHPAAGDWCAIGQEIRSKLVVGKSYSCSFRYKVLLGNNMKLILCLGSDQLSKYAYNIAGGASELIEDNSWHTISTVYTESESVDEKFQQIAIYFDYNCSEAEGAVLIDDIEVIELVEEEDL